MPVLKKVTAPVIKEKRSRGRPKGSTKIKSPWYKFICPKCGATYGAMMQDAEFSCYHNGCKGTVCKRKGK